MVECIIPALVAECKISIQVFLNGGAHFKGMREWELSKIKVREGILVFY